MYHNLLIHSYADGHLGCFHVPAIVNSAAMTIGVHASLSVLVSSVFKRIPFSQHPCQHLLFLDFLIAAIMTSVGWYIMVLLICISLIMREVGHLFMCLLAICMSSVEKCLFRSLAQFWLGHLFFWYWAAWAAYIFWRLILCQLFHLLLFFPILKSAFLPCL